MRVIRVPENWWKGLWQVCQHCGATVEFAGDAGEMKVYQPGDFKDEGTLKWDCAHCHVTNYGSYSRMTADSKRLKNPPRPLVITG